MTLKCQMWHRWVPGDALTPETQEFLEQTGLPTLSKPFDVEEVRHVVRHTVGTAVGDSR